MTNRRYYDDSYTARFEAQVTECADRPGAPSVILDQTYFYPTSGGQPHDTGRLGGAAVIDVQVRETDGAIIHRVDRPLEPGPVAAEIDWPRRHDHMQQHTGQHILSQAFIQRAGAATIGFHLGQETVSIDLDLPRLDDPAVADAEALANEVVSRNLTVRAWFPAGDELPSLPLRKAPEVRGPLRVVAIGDFDYSACGGTHVAATGEVGLIALLRTERLGRGTRVEFLCGARARADYARKHAMIRELTASLTCSPAEVNAAVARLSAALVESRRQVARHLERELEQEAGQRLDRAMRTGRLRVVAGAWAGRPIEELKGLALRMTAVPGVIVLLGVAGARSQLVFARSEDVKVDLKPLFERTLNALGGGKGGGSRIMQGAAGETTLDQLESVLSAVAADIGDPGE